MKEKLTFIFLTFYSFFSFSQVALNSPTDHANFLGVEQIYLEWIEDIDLSGGNVSYDLYFGTNSNPILYYSDLTPNTNGEIDTDTYIYQGAIMDGANTIPTSIFFKQITLNYETTYYWKVVAKNTNGVLSISNTFSFTTIRENTLPTTPNLLSPANGLTDVNAKPTLSWSESIDADNDPITYRVFFKEDHPGSNFSFLTETTETSYTISTTLKDYTSYIWYIQAVDGYEGASANVSSNTASFTVENYQNDAPTASTLSTPENSATNIGFHVNFSWIASTDADDEPMVYDVYADANSNPQTLIASNISTTTFLYTFNTYDEIYWKVVAKDNFGNATTSDIWSFTCWKNSPIHPPEMINVEGGTFTMGQSELTQIQIGVLINGDPLYMDISNENPAHQITLSDYKIGTYEVTNTQYVDFLNSILDDIVIEPTDFRVHRNKGFSYRRASYKGNHSLCKVFDATRDLSTRANIDYEPNIDSPIIWNGTSFELDANYANHPIRWMYYTGAKLYGEWLGNYRLPTEAEWEYAALGGNQSLGYTYSGSNNVDDVAFKSRTSTASVGTKLPNELGIYDMSGNVSEICEDYFALNYYANSPTINPINTVYTNFGHVTRGRSFQTEAAYFRIKSRFRLSGEQYMDTSGFRLAKSADYTVSGNVTDTQGNPLANVSVLGFPTSVLTDVNGNYSTSLTGGWSGTVSTYLNGYTNNTGIIKLNNLTENSINNDFVLEQEITMFDFTILVTNGINPLNGVSVNFNGLDYITNTKGEIQINNLIIGTYNYVIKEVGFYEATGSAILTEDNLIKTIVLQEQSLSIDDLELDEARNKFIVYPNPSKINEDFFIKYDGKGEVNIYNISGQLVYENNIKNSLKVSLKNKGVFFIVIKSESSVLSKKIIIR